MPVKSELWGTPGASGESSQPAQSRRQQPGLLPHLAHAGGSWSHITVQQLKPNLTSLEDLPKKQTDKYVLLTHSFPLQKFKIHSRKQARVETI